MKILFLSLILAVTFGTNTAEAGKKKETFKVGCPKDFTLKDNGNSFVCWRDKKKGKTGKTYPLDCKPGYDLKVVKGPDFCIKSGDGALMETAADRCRTMVWDGTGELTVSVDHKGNEDICVDNTVSAGAEFREPKFTKNK